jgi:hypothetical protein
MTQMDGREKYADSFRVGRSRTRTTTTTRRIGGKIKIRIKIKIGTKVEKRGKKQGWIPAGFAV